MTDISVLVVDDQQVVREGLAALLDRLDAGGVDVVLMDLRMPTLGGAAATARVRENHPDVAVLVPTTYSDDESIAAALAAGARGYLTKDAGRTELAAAIRSAAAGQSTFDPEVSRRLVSALVDGNRQAPPPRGANPDRLTAPGTVGAASPRHHRDLSTADPTWITCSLRARTESASSLVSLRS